MVKQHLLTYLGGDPPGHDDLWPIGVVRLTQLLHLRLLVSILSALIWNTNRQLLSVVASLHVFASADVNGVEVPLRISHLDIVFGRDGLAVGVHLPGVHVLDTHGVGAVRGRVIAVLTTFIHNRYLRCKYKNNQTGHLYIVPKYNFN